MDLKDCFIEDFSIWLNNSNHPKIRPYISDVSKLNKIVEESLAEILDILLREPQADYFWYGPIWGDKKLSYSLPHNDEVPSDALRVDKEKMKVFLRDYKIQMIID